MRRVAAVSPYDEIAEWYDDWVGPDPTGGDPFLSAAEALMGDIASQYLCDLACGQGRVARRLANLGARVVGVDASAKLLAIARRREETDPRGVAYIHADARDLGVSEEAFDGVVCHMALMDIPDLPLTLRSTARILRPGGWFVFSILHPCYNTAQSGEILLPEGWVRTVGGYFAEGHWRSDARTGPPGKVGAYHRTLSTYFNALIDAGFAVDRVSEPRLTGSNAEKRPVWAEVPAVLIARCSKKFLDGEST